MKIINFIKEIRWGIAVALILLLFTFLLCLIAMSDKYDKELINLRQENEKLEKDNKKHLGTIEDLLKKVEGKRSIECDCDCEWLRSFYDEFHEQVGAFE